MHANVSNSRQGCALRHAWCVSNAASTLMAPSSRSEVDDPSVVSSYGERICVVGSIYYLGIRLCTHLPCTLVSANYPSKNAPSTCCDLLGSGLGARINVEHLLTRVEERVRSANRLLFDSLLVLRKCLCLRQTQVGRVYRCGLGQRARRWSVRTSTPVADDTGRRHDAILDGDAPIGLVVVDFGARALWYDDSRARMHQGHLGLVLRCFGN